MQNGLKIKWTEEAINNLEDILSYLKIRWTTREINRFFIKLEKQLIILSLFPEAFPRSQINFVHRCVFQNNLQSITQLKMKILLSYPFLIIGEIHN